MSKLSLRKKNDKNNKITGFFTVKHLNDEHANSDIPRTVLQDIENKMPKDTDNILVSPNLRKFEGNEIDATPDLAQKPKRKRKDDVSDDGTSILSTEMSSPVFKRSKSVSYTSPIKGTTLQTINESPLKKSSSKKAECDDLWEEEENDDFMACFDDSFSMSPSNVCSDENTKKEKDNDSLTAKYGRHKVLNVFQESNSLILDLVEEGTTSQGRIKKLTLKGSWVSIVVNADDIVNVDVKWRDDDSAVVDDKEGLIVVHPDTLVSGTAVVSALFCMRKAYLSEKFKGQEGGNRVMLIGTAVHELLQEAVRNKCYSKQSILAVLDKIMTTPKMISDILSLGLHEGDIRKEVQEFIIHIQYFVKKFMFGEFVAKPENEEDKSSKKPVQKEQWKGKIVEVCDIEENFWSPRLGIKGKIDLTVKTETSRGEVSVQPLELKTGKASHSSSHKGQVMLYCMMSGDRRAQARAGLLLYLRSSDMTQVPAGHHEQRGLVQLRNELVSWLHNPGPELPEPISHEGACRSCGLIEVCSSYQRLQGTIPVAPHPMASMVPQVTGHLSQKHLDWFKKWTDLLDMEFADSRGGAELKDLWCLSPAEREARGQAITALRLETVTSGQHRFVRPETAARTGRGQGLSSGELVVVSTDSCLALSMGPITSLTSSSVEVILDRDLTQLASEGAVFHLDRYIYQSAQSSCYVGVARLLSDNPEAARLRETCIDFAMPTTLAGLGREVVEHGKAVLRPLNKIQQRAVLRSVMSERFSLIRGMPGTGKTTTIVGLVRLLARMGQSVLLVAYTHSAVDTILSKLQAADQSFLRLGRRERVKPELWPSCAEILAEGVTSVSGLGRLYSSFSVVASTCLAVSHPATAGRKFDWVVCDEASQALLPSVLPALLLAEKFVLVGDHAQLPPTVQSSRAREGGLDQSLFSILDTRHPAATSCLTLQYRMNSRISELANHLTYEGKLQCGDPEVRDRILHLQRNDDCSSWIFRSLNPDISNSVVFVDTAGFAREDKEVGGIHNSREAGLVTRLVTELVSCAVEEKEIGVIAPYSAQVKFIKVPE